MIIKLRDILNAYTDEELKDMDLWINSGNVVDSILIDENSINLITTDTEIKLDGFITKEGH